MQEVKETPIREIELEGYKALQYYIQLPNSLGSFLLAPVLPTQQYLEAYFDTYSKNHGEPETLQSIKQFLGKPARSINFPRLELLFVRDRRMAQGYTPDDSWQDFNLWDDFIHQALSRLDSTITGTRQKLEALGKLQPTIDKLQIVFEKPEHKQLPAVYDSAMKMIDIKHAGTPAELIYLDFLEDAMANFEKILRRNIGIGSPFSLFDEGVRFFNILYRKQPMFNNRILAYDLPRIIRKNDLWLDKILTPLLMLGWAVEPVVILPKTPQQIQKLAERFLKLYLVAQTYRAFYEREIEAHKQEAQRLHNDGMDEKSFSEFEYEDDNGNLVVAQELEQALIEPGQNPLTRFESQEAREGLLQKLTPRQKEIIELLDQGFTQREVAKRLGTTEAFISQQIKLMSKRIKL